MENVGPVEAPQAPTHRVLQFPITLQWKFAQFKLPSRKLRQVPIIARIRESARLKLWVLVKLLLALQVLRELLRVHVQLLPVYILESFTAQLIPPQHLAGKSALPPVLWRPTIMLVTAFKFKSPNAETTSCSLSLALKESSQLALAFLEPGN